MPDSTPSSQYIAQPSSDAIAQPGQDTPEEFEPILDDVEVRILGCLLEKEILTPSLYPLTLNSLVLACNQRDNRDPVVQLTESEVHDGFSRLKHKGFARIIFRPEWRQPKHRHCLEEKLELDDQLRSILTVLLLRGPQTTGELKARTERLGGGFQAPDEISSHLLEAGNVSPPLFVLMPRLPGQKEQRWTQLLGKPADEAPTSAEHAVSAAPSSATADLEELINQVAGRVDAQSQQIEVLLERLARLEADLGLADEPQT